MRRAVSLVPSITEILRTWGHDPIACTKYCEQPDLAHVGGTKNPDIDAIAALEPDVVLLDKEENRREDADALTARGLEVVAVDVRSIETTAQAMETIRRAVGLDLDASLDVGPARSGRRLQAFVPIWRRPWMTIGARTYGADLLDHLGVDGVVPAGASSDYPEVTLEQMAALECDVVLVPSEPYEFTDAHFEEMSVVAPAVAVDGQDLFWWGTRTPAAIERLRGVIDAVAFDTSR